MARDDDKPAKSTTPAPPAKKVQYVGGESLVDRLLPHVKKIAVGAIFLAVILSAYFGWRAHERGKQAESTARFAKVNELALRPIEPPPVTPPSDPNHPPAPVPAPVVDPEHPTYPDRATRANAVLAELANAGGTAGHSYRGGFLIDAGKFDEAITEYKAGATGDDMEAALCREGLGLALEQKALAATDAAQKQSGLEAALAAFVAEQPDAAGPRYGYALYHQARLQELLGKTADAKATYEKVKTLDDAKTELTALVSKRLAALGAS